MPQGLAHFPWTALYPLIGLYRLLHDPKIRTPIWNDCKSIGIKAILGALLWSIVAYPWNRGAARMLMSYSPKLVAKYSEGDFLRIPIASYAGLIFSTMQATFIIERALTFRLRKARKQAYDMVVRSRQKDPDFWTPYVEEFHNPPNQLARKKAKEQVFWMRMGSPLIKYILHKAITIPFTFVPFLGIFISSYISSMSLARVLHRPFFEAKKMTPEQIELWIVERRWSYQIFGFVASILEHIPIAGVLFSVSNRCGSAMWAHDLEKRQHYVREHGIPSSGLFNLKRREQRESQRPVSSSSSAGDDELNIDRKRYISGMEDNAEARVSGTGPSLPPR